MFDNEARLSWVLAALAGVIGAAALLHTSGYFVTFMTGNSERAIVNWFDGQSGMALSAIGLIISFVAGVFVASWCRRHFWTQHPHGPVLLTTASLAVATTIDYFSVDPMSGPDLDLLPILFVAFGTGALNTSFVKDGEVSVPITYYTGSLVKMGQGLERHLAGGGTPADWLGYFLIWASFLFGGLIGGLINMITDGLGLLLLSTVVCLVVTGYTYLHLDRHGPLPTE
ncbi:YoaK family protein [Nocardia sp. NPDC050406]|uniref:YoaK family protein n=1 Tax=Nocardia sp. NPDC050406 TaxID=3364318 RepID=UPI0037A934E0